MGPSFLALSLYSSASISLFLYLILSFVSFLANSILLCLLLLLDVDHHVPAKYCWHVSTTDSRLLQRWWAGFLALSLIRIFHPFIPIHFEFCFHVYLFFSFTDWAMIYSAPSRGVERVRDLLRVDGGWTISTRGQTNQSSLWLSWHLGWSHQEFESRSKGNDFRRRHSHNHEKEDIFLLKSSDIVKTAEDDGIGKKSC